MSGATKIPAGVLLVDSITRFDAASRNAVVGRDQTGIAALACRDERGLAAAAGQTLQDFIRVMIAAETAADKGTA